MKVLSVFDGCAGGFQSLKECNKNVTNYFSYEIDNYARKIALKNHQNLTPRGSVIGAKFPKADLLIGGSPCQSFSLAGKGEGFQGESKLFFEYVRALEACKPKYFFLENVVMSKSNEDVITGLLGVKPIKVNSKIVSAQERVRLYWTNIPYTPEAKPTYLKDIIEKKVDEKYYLSQTHLQRMLNRPSRVFDTADTTTRTIIASYGKRPSDAPYYKDEEGRYRMFTPLEVERLQTLPDNYTKGVSDTQRYRMLGNGWNIATINCFFKNL